ncbi:hydroxyproline O-arabinosyltransferase 1-like [Wolffia australiana]
MGCESFFYSLLISISAALITYNILVSSTAPFKSGFPGHGLSILDSTFHGFSGVDPVVEMPSYMRKSRGGDKKKRLFHTAVTSSDAVYNTWQTRIMYYWYKKFQDKPGSEMGGFTRILHSGRPDKYMDEIPTFVADPLSSNVHQGYVVLNRPWAFVQWLQKAKIQEDYILMAEPDHLIVKPIPNLAKGGLAAAFPFFYIDPPRFESVLRKFFPVEKGPIKKVDPIGNSPVIIDKESLKKIAPTWMNISLAMKNDKAADKAFGWVLEMYAYAVASALHGVDNILHKDFMLQPPWDLTIGDKYILHYTYGCDYDLQGRGTPGKFGEWRFDKRSYSERPPPKNLAMPPKGVPESVVTLVKMVNEATANIPNWES